ncbi:MAG: substrate-binding domain-containing protein [Candidatus Muiribacteriota bacterium]
MKKILFTILFCLIYSIVFAKGFIKLATTTSIENTGIIYALNDEFTKKTGIRVQTIPLGTGKALKLAENGDVDVVFVHSEKDELNFVDNGYGINRKTVMYNYFILTGPESDPAGIKNMPPVEAFTKIYSTKSPFYSRGDESGTHVREKEIWKKTGISDFHYNNYFETGQGMGATLQIADYKNGYCLSDKGTYLAFQKQLKDSIIMAECADVFLNKYSVIGVNPFKHQHVKLTYVSKYINFLVSEKAKEIIKNYKKYGEQLFYIY